MDDAAFFRALRAEEFPHLDAQGLAYLDYTGSALPALSQLRAHDQLIRSEVFGNPHSDNGPSRRSTGAIEDARQRILRFTNADPDEYAAVFTANSSSAAKLVGEAFPFTDRSTLVLSADNHNSVNGIREFALRSAARVVTLPLDDELRLHEPEDVFDGPAPDAPHLFAFPAQSNFSGVEHPLGLVNVARERGYTVLLDAAAYAPTHALDLARTPADFVMLSFYKMFGFPTGVGALVARREALAALNRPWFAGGTVDWVSVQHRRHQLKTTADAFEDGTPNFLGIAALGSGLDLLSCVGMTALRARVRVLTSRLLDALASGTRPDGTPLFEIYGPREVVARGGTIAFNILDGDGRAVPYEDVERALSEQGISVRGGCFCNPGAAEAAFGFPADETLDCLQRTSSSGFTPRRFADCLASQVPVGAIRVSVGLATSESDLDRCVDALTRFGHHRD